MTIAIATCNIFVPKKVQLKAGSKEQIRTKLYIAA